MLSIASNALYLGCCKADALCEDAAKGYFPQLRVCSAKHPLPLLAYFRNIFPLGTACFRTNIFTAVLLTHQFSNLTVSFLFGETKLERVFQNHLVSL